MVDLPAYELTVSLEEASIVSLDYNSDQEQDTNSSTHINLQLVAGRVTLTSTETGSSSIWDVITSTYFSDCRSIPAIYRNTTAIPVTSPNETIFERTQYAIAKPAVNVYNESGAIVFTPIVLTNVQSTSAAACYMAAAMQQIILGDGQIELYDSSAILFTTATLTDFAVQKYQLRVSDDGFQQDITLAFVGIDFSP
jgi:hypothetical protein